MYLVLVILLLLLVLGGLPQFPVGARYGWGYGPSSAVSIILVVLIVLLLTGRL